MATGTGTCYTWSGDKKIYEPDLFKSELKVYSTEYCFRYDSANSYTLVFGKVPENFNPNHPEYTDEVHTYLPCFGLSINHNIQPNGEDHYTLSGTYTGPRNWSPPAGLDGPFYSEIDLKYPYYEYTYTWQHYIYTWYEDIKQTINITVLFGTPVYYYGNKKKK